MNFDYSEEQNLIKDSIAKYLQNNYDFDTRKKIAASELGYSNEHWQQFAELGWLAIPFAEDLGGFGGNAIDDVIVMEELGKGLALEPYLATVIMIGGLLADGPDASRHEQDIAAIIDGSLQGAVAFTEAQSRYELADVKTTALLNNGKYILNGEKVVVANGQAANKLIISARTAGEQSDTTGITLFYVDASADGLSKRGYPMMDGHRVANITLSDVAVDSKNIVGELHHGHDNLARAIDRAIIATAAEALGIMEKLLHTTVAYTQTRKQFGVAIGSFQALQHRLVDMFINVEQTRSLLLRAACSNVEAQQVSDPNTCEELLRKSKQDTLALKVMVAQVGKLVGDEALQMHGGIGMTDELDVGHYVKRLLRINTMFGDEDYSMQAFAKGSLG
ncbi:MAG: acyl-CoA dehydrogenase family protein [Pseudomonadales bacterium]|nr:acyl-CoA dehydrogenase family protein [Pseudomonadales bacterium]